VNGEQMGRAVTGISHIEYIFPIATYVHMQNKDSITKEEILSIVREEAIRREKEKALALGKFWQDYEKKLAKKKSFLKGITDSLILAMRKWGLIEDARTKEIFQVLPPLRDIGKLNSMTEVEKAKIRLYELILRSKKETPFEPFNLLMQIRNNVLDEIEAIVKRDHKKIIERFQVPYSEGRVYNDNFFVYKKLGTNFRSFDIMTDWGYFFELLDTYETSPILIKEAKRRVLYPKYEVFLTKVISTINEMNQFLEFAKEKTEPLSINDFQDKFKYSKYATISVLHNLKALDLLEYKEEKIGISSKALSIQDVKELTKAIFEKITTRGGLIILDAPEEKAVLSTFSTNINPNYTLIMLNPSWSLEDFEKSIRSAYDRLTKGMVYRYVWISKLRKEVCRELRIHSSTFDSFLCKLGEEKPEIVEFAKAAGDVTRRMLTKFDKTFKFRGNVYRMIRIGG
jgi:hypothetical protein